MKIIGTEKIKGVLDLSSIKTQFKKGQSLNVRDDDYWQSDVQSAIRMGFLKVEGKLNNESEEDGDKVFKCKNTHIRSISMNENSSEIKPGQTFILRQRELESPAVKNAISRGMIKVLSTGSEEASEVSVNVTKLLKGQDQGVERIEGFEEEDDGDLGIANLLTGKKKPKVQTDTNEEISTPTVIIKESDIRPIKDEKGVDWNAPVEERQVFQVKSPTNIITSDHPDPVDSNIGDPKGKSVVMDPNKQSRYMNYMKDDSVVFVDKSQEKERIDAHPTMDPEVKKLAAQNQDLDIIEDIDEDEKRRQQHPVLGKKTKDDSDISFVG